MEESLYPAPVKGKKSKAEKKALKEQQALAAAAINASRALAIVQPTKQTARKSALTSQQKLGAVGNSKSASAIGQQSAVAGSSSKTVASDEKSKAIVPLEASKPTQAELDAAEDFSNFYYDLHERKQRKRDFRKKGKKHEHIACQHPCHGKVCNCNPHKHVHTHDHTHDHTHNHAHDHAHDHTHDHHHDHHHNHDAPTREELMNCLCEKHKAMAKAKIAALQKQSAHNDGQQAEDKNPDRDKSSEVKTLENGSSEDNSPGVESLEENNSEGKNSGGINKEGVSLESKCSEDKTSEDVNSESSQAEGKSSEMRLTEGEGKVLEGKTSSPKSSEEDKDVVGDAVEGTEEAVKSPRGKKSHKRIRENGVVSSEDSSDCDGAVERFVRRTFPELHLQEPHPNQVYEQMVADEKAEKEEKSKESKLRTCAFCRRQEVEVKTFKKCQK